jgi:RNA polymerase sigma-70 factor (ECF subfamily)
MYASDGVLSLTLIRMFPADDDATAMAQDAGDAVAASSGIQAERSVESIDESVLVSRLSAFEPEAWQSIFDSYFASIFRLAYVRTRHRDAAEDIAAQTFAEAAEGIRRYRYRGVPFRAWLYRIARNLASDHVKAERRKPQVSLAEAPSLEAGAADSESNVDFLAAVDELTADQKTVVLLRLVDGYSQAEVANVLGKSVGAVKQLQHRALTTLQQRMAPDETDGGVKR